MQQEMHAAFDECAGFAGPRAGDDKDIAQFAQADLLGSGQHCGIIRQRPADLKPVCRGRYQREVLPKAWVGAAR